MEKIEKISKKEESEPGCLCAFLGILGFAIKQAWKEVKAEWSDREYDDCCQPKGRTNASKPIHPPKRERS